MRLTAELINGSLSYLNPLKERELDLRGHKIPAIENLAVAGAHDALDLTDNGIASVGNFPLSPRLRTLLLARNRVRMLESNVGATLPNLRHLVLTANHMAELADLEPLRKCAHLTHLSLIDNPVARKDHYRLWIVWRLPTVRFLDFRRVTDQERERAADLFGAIDAPTALASSILGVKSRTFDVPSTNNDAADPSAAKAYRVKLTEKERKKVEELIRSAKTLSEITRLEKELNEGRVPALAQEG